MNTRRLDWGAMALTCAPIRSVGLVLLPRWAVLLEGISTDPTRICIVQRGHPFRPVGSPIGFGRAFTDGLIAGAHFARLLNRISGRGPAAVQTG